MAMLFEKSITRETISIVSLGLCFMILFSAEFTMLNMQKTIVSSIQDDRPEFQVDGYTLHGITYSVTCISYWLAPSVISVIGPKPGMVLAAVGYSIYIASMNAEQTWVMYSVAVFVGISNTLLWTGEGNYLTVISKPEHIPRNIGIFWMLFISAEFYGNLFTYVKLSGLKYIDRDTRRMIIYVLASVAITSAVCFSLLKKVKVEKSGESKQGPLEALKNTWKLFKTKNLLILSATFCFTVTITISTCSIRANNTIKDTCLNTDERLTCYSLALTLYWYYDAFTYSRKFHHARGLWKNLEHCRTFDNHL